MTPTGFGAVFLTLFSILRPGDELIIADPVYSPTRNLTEKYLKDFKILAKFYNPNDLSTIKKNITKKLNLFM